MGACRIVLFFFAIQAILPNGLELTEVRVPDSPLATMNQPNTP